MKLRDLHNPSGRVVITGIGLIASIGEYREAVWRSVAAGRCGVRRLRNLPGIPDDLLIAADVDIQPERPGGLKVTALCHRAAAEAVDDAQLDWSRVDLDRFGCAVSAHMGDLGWVAEQAGRRDLISLADVPWHQQWLPNTTCCDVANRLGLRGPRISHSTACASGLIDVLSGVRAIQDGQCDLVLAGSGEAIHPLFAAGFHRMGVLASHPEPEQACRPFDAGRSGFVMGEGAGILVLERLSHALRRRAPIYAEILAGKVVADARHVTDLDSESDALCHLIGMTLRRARLQPRDVGYICAHGTATLQNDLMEARGIRRAFGPAADRVCISSVKPMVGHLVNAAGSVELAMTALSLRDGFIPPTLNLTDPDPQCDLDCTPLVGRRCYYEHALKISLAFGGTFAAVALRRWESADGSIAALPRAA